MREGEGSDDWVEGFVLLMVSSDVFRYFLCAYEAHNNHVLRPTRVSTKRDCLSLDPIGRILTTRRRPWTVDSPDNRWSQQACRIRSFSPARSNSNLRQIPPQPLPLKPSSHYLPHHTLLSNALPAILRPLPLPLPSSCDRILQRTQIRLPPPQHAPIRPRRLLPILPLNSLHQQPRHNLPTHPELILYPAALLRFPTIRYHCIVVGVDFSLCVAEEGEGEGFVEGPGEGGCILGCGWGEVEKE